MLLATQNLQFPPTRDLIGLLPELILSGAFVILLMLDLVTPPSRRSLLAAVSLVALAAAMGAVVWGWFDADHARTIYAGSFAYDRFGRFVDGIVIASAALTVAISPDYLNRRGLHFGEYYALILAATVGMMLLAGAASLIVIFLGIELLSISLYILSGFAHTETRSQEAALKYLLLGGFASGILLYGMALIYGATGHTQLTLIKQSLAGSSGTDPLFLVGVGLLFVGFAFKVSAAPFHWWTPDVYQGAPTSVTTFMSVATKVAAFASLIRVFTYTFADSTDKWTGIVAFVAIISMVVGNVAALTQTSLKRMLAYSGIAQAGYILIGVAVSPDPLGTVGSLYYLAAYAATNLGAFAVITVLAGRGEDLDSYDGIRGLAYRRPYTAAAMAFFLFSLGGFPPTAGFFAKFLVFSAAIHAHAVYLALWGIGTSVISIFYYLRVGLLMYTRPKEGEETYPWARTSLAGGGVLAASAAGTLVLGILVFLIYTAAVSAQHGVLPVPQQLA
ncbi:MAG: NADH-quinone oxidoreductase subunit N [Chloroflexi bacterium]|nr:MAG: NADH-quinone oxidoreductase subunit N [Chloroflexota bacterium]